MLVEHAWWLHSPLPVQALFRLNFQASMLVLGVVCGVTTCYRTGQYLQQKWIRTQHNSQQNSDGHVILKIPTTYYYDRYLLTIASVPHFATFASGGGGGSYNPPWRSAHDCRRASWKKQSMRLDEISRLHILFLVLGQHLTPLCQVKGQIFAKNYIFFNFTRS